MDDQIKQRVTNVYQDRFLQKPKFMVTAPGRINLIGEHTDYSDGYVLPVAIDLGIALAMSPREDDKIVIHSLDFEETKEISISNLEQNGDGWIAYIKGIIWALLDQGYSLKGWQGIIAGTIPIGAGLSSSAAFEIACLQAFCQSSGFTLSLSTMAKIARKAENSWVGIQVGIMDQLISAAGKKGFALLLDCQSLSYDFMPIPMMISFIVLDTTTRRDLSVSAYNTRHDEIAEVTKLLGIKTLRDGSLSKLESKRPELPDNLYRRALHVISENNRVIKFASAMKDQDLHLMGDLIKQSHVSLRDNFEVSSEALNCIVDIAQNQPGCYGARMTGAGFGGCALALVEKARSTEFINQTTNKFFSFTGTYPHVFSVQSVDGVSISELIYR